MIGVRVRIKVTLVRVKVGFGRLLPQLVRARKGFFTCEVQRTSVGLDELGLE